MAQNMKITWTNTAKDDLYEIYEYLSEFLEEDKAFALVSRLIERVDILEKYPFSGQKEPLLSELPKEYRRLIEGKYKIIYHVGSDDIFINRVFDSRKDPSKLKIDEK